MVGPSQTHRRRCLLSTLLVAIAACAAGCTLTGLEAGFTLTPPGGFFKLGHLEDPAPATQPVKIIPVEIESSVATAPPIGVDVPAPTGHDPRAAD